MKRITLAAPEGRSADLVAENVKSLARLFPDVVSEGKVDVAALLQQLGEGVAEDNEKFGLSWHGKSHARQAVLATSVGTLRPCPDESVDWDSTNNLMIEGDNLEVLKILQKSYANRVKLVYIDPPYNTGKDFVYQDNYKDGITNYLKATSQMDDSGKKLSSNADASGRFHTNWLNMIYPRLKLARTLLRQDGLLVVSISDAEVHHLRMILDELFGSDSFIGCVMWNSTKSVTNTALISVSHTYNLIYARDRDYFVENRTHFRLAEDGDGFANPDNDPRGPWKADPFQVGGERPNQMYPITNPTTGEVYRPNPGNSWKNELKVYERHLADNRIVFGASGEAGPQRKRFLSEAEERGRVAKTWWDDVDTTANATKAAKELMGENVFDNPKPTSLINRFVQLGTHDLSDAIVVDFFAGSGTTSQGVIQQNLADGGKRRYILIQLPQPLSLENNEQKAAARYCLRKGLPPNLAELTKEQLRRFAQTIADSSKPTNVDLGFRVFKLDSSNVRTWQPDRTNISQSIIDYVDHIKPDRSEDDLFCELLLKLGYDLCVPREERWIASKCVWYVSGVGEKWGGGRINDLFIRTYRGKRCGGTSIGYDHLAWRTARHGRPNSRVP